MPQYSSIPRGSACVDRTPLTARSALEQVLTPGRFGASVGAPGVTVTERRGLWLASVVARRDAIDQLDAVVQQHFGRALPRTPRVATGQGIAFAWAGPGEWLAVAPVVPAPFIAAVTGLASVVDQSDGRLILRVSGPNARDTLAKGLPVDLHPSAFGPSDTALTAASHIGLQIWQVDDAPTYDIAVPRGYAASFWRWLAGSAAEFGYVVGLE